MFWIGILTGAVLVFIILTILAVILEERHFDDENN